MVARRAGYFHSSRDRRYYSASGDNHASAVNHAGDVTPAGYRFTARAGNNGAAGNGRHAAPNNRRRHNASARNYAVTRVTARGHCPAGSGYLLLVDSGRTGVIDAFIHVLFPSRQAAQERTGKGNLMFDNVQIKPLGSGSRAGRLL